MRLRKKKGWIIALLIFIAPVILFVAYWAWKYYVLPEWPDHKEYRIIEQRAEKALDFAKQHNMNEHYALFVNYSLPSGTPRLFVWDFHKKKIITSSYLMHGSGGGSTAERPIFSNEPGSECSSLGRFLVTKEHGQSLKRSFRLKGLDSDNKTAYSRGLMIHSAGWVNDHCWNKYIPLRRSSCQGCVTVSSKGMKYLWRLVNKEKTQLLLWSYYGEKTD